MARLPFSLHNGYHDLGRRWRHTPILACFRRHALPIAPTVQVVRDTIQRGEHWPRQLRRDAPCTPHREQPPASVLDTCPEPRSPIEWTLPPARRIHAVPSLGQAEIRREVVILALGVAFEIPPQCMDEEGHITWGGVIVIPLDARHNALRHILPVPPVNSTIPYLRVAPCGFVGRAQGIQAVGKPAFFAPVVFTFRSMVAEHDTPVMGLALLKRHDTFWLPPRAHSCPPQRNLIF